MNRLCLHLVILAAILVSSCSYSRSRDTSYTKTSRVAKKGKKPSPTLPLIVLDPGHGGGDEGARVRTLQEKRVTLLTALLAKEYLTDLGYRVELTRRRDHYIPLSRRASFANDKLPSPPKGVLFVSIHYNASPNHSAKGIEVYYSDANDPQRIRASRRLAKCVLSQVLLQTHAESRGIKGGNFHVIRETKMPAILLEGGFITNAEERAHLRQRKYLEKIAKGIAHGVDRYVHLSR